MYVRLQSARRRVGLLARLCERVFPPLFTAS